MANHKSAKNRIVRNSKRAVMNGARRSRARTFIKKVEAELLDRKSVVSGKSGVVSVDTDCRLFIRR